MAKKSEDSNLPGNVLGSTGGTPGTDSTLPTAPVSVPTVPNAAEIPSNQLGELIALLTKQNEVLMGRVAALEADKNGAPTLDKRRKDFDHIATVRFIENLPVVRYGNADDVVQPNNRSKLMINVVVLNGTKEEQRLEDYAKLLNDYPLYRAKIVKKTPKKFTAYQTGRMMEVEAEDPDPYQGGAEKRKPWNGERVVLEEERVSITTEVEFIEGPMKGKTLTIESDALNRS